VIGCTAGLVILTMCVTGVLLAFERQINDAADRSSRAPVVVTGARLPIDSVVAQTAQPGGAPSAITVFAESDAPIALAYGRERLVYADPYSGKILGEGAKGSRSFFAFVERIHRTLGSPFQSRSFGHALTGACNLAFFGLLLSGAYLWLPKKWTAQYLKPSMLFRIGLSGRAKHWNRHNVAAAWCVVPLFFIILSGVIMSYPWANNLLYRLAGSEPPPARPEERSPGRRAHRQDNAPRASFEDLFAKAKEQSAAWRSISLRVANEAPVAVFTIDEGNGGQPNKRSQLTLDARTGQVRKWEPFGSLSLGRRLRSWARFLHTGEAGGLLGQIIATLATLGGVLLVWTGFAMALLRLRKRIARQRRQQSSEYAAIGT
jgi:uncharacterized iron-regulated membrane protein